MARTLRQLTTCCVALGLLAACGGGSDDAASTTTGPDTTSTATAPPTTAVPPTSPPTTEPIPTTEPPATAPTTTAPTTTEPGPVVEYVDTTIAEGGFLTMQIVDGWSVDTIQLQPARTFEDAIGLPWEASVDTLVELVTLARDGSSGPTPEVTMGVFREGRYRLVDSVFDWDTAIADLIGISPNIDLTVEWGGGRGESTRGRLGATYVRHESVQVGDQFITVIALSDDQPTEQLDAEVSAMIDSIQIDPSALGLLNHSIDLKMSISADVTGSTPFSLGILAPPYWAASEDFEGYWFDPFVNAADPEAPLPSLDVYMDVVVGDVVAMVEAEFEARANDWFVVEPVPEDIDIDDIPATVFWEGDPATAEGAVIMVSDGVVFAAAYIYTPGDPELLQAMVTSAQVRLSAINPEGL